MNDLLSCLGCFVGSNFLQYQICQIYSFTIWLVGLPWPQYWVVSGGKEFVEHVKIIRIQFLGRVSYNQLK